MASEVTAEDVEKFRRIALSLSPADRAAIMGAAQTSGSAPAYKLSPVLDALSDGEATAVVHACRAGLKHVMESGSPSADGEALDMVAKVSPVVANTMRLNSRERRKDFAHSLQAASGYLQSDAYHAKRERKRREVPPAEPARPAEPKTK